MKGSMVHPPNAFALWLPMKKTARGYHSHGQFKL